MASVYNISGGLISKAILVVLAVILVLVALYFALGSSPALFGKNNVAIALTDPPNVPQGTRQLLVSYSSVDVHVSGSGNQSGWVSATGSGTVNLLALTNVSQTIASAGIATNSTINLVRFNISSVSITINNSTYNVTSPNNHVTVAVTGSSKINSSSAVLIDFYPTVNAHTHGNANTTTYVLVPAARAVVVGVNATMGINTNIGSTATINSGVRARLGVGISGNSSSIGIGLGNGNENTSNSSVVAGVGQRVSNFMIDNISYSSGTVTGLLYIEYPVASNTGTNTVLHANDSIGYACDNTEFKLTSIYSNGTAVFTKIQNTAKPGGCPI